MRYTVELSRHSGKGQNGRDPTMNIPTRRPTALLMRRLARTLKRHLTGAAAGEPVGVHQARVTSRRLREAIPVLSTGLRGSRAGKATRKIRRLTRTLGTVRELDVTLALLEELAATPDIPRTAVEEVRATVVREREARHAAMLRRLEALDHDKLGRRLASVSAALDAAATEPWRKALGARLLARSRALVSAMDAAGHVYAPEQLHEVRIAAKKLRYGLELAVDAGVKAAAPHVRTIKGVQEMLGKLHDLQVLQSHIGATQIGGAPARPEPRAALDALAAHVEAQCRHLHGKYLSAGPGLREIPAVVRKIVVPQLTPRRQPAAKMSLSRRPAAAASRGTR